MTVLTQLANPFDFRTHAVRTAIGPDGQAWFCAMDVFASMGITWKGSAGSLKNVPENWRGVCYLQTPRAPRLRFSFLNPLSISPVCRAALAPQKQLSK